MSGTPAGDHSSAGGTGTDDKVRAPAAAPDDPAALPSSAQHPTSSASTHGSVTQATVRSLGHATRA
jgi:hypothetical protein